MVEDNEEVRRAVVDMLKGWGYRVVAVENPDAAADLLETDSAFDLLFTDVVMPGVMSAVELAQHRPAAPAGDRRPADLGLCARPDPRARGGRTSR